MHTCLAQSDVSTTETAKDPAQEFAILVLVAIGLIVLWRMYKTGLLRRIFGALLRGGVSLGILVAVIYGIAMAAGSAATLTAFFERNGEVAKIGAVLWWFICSAGWLVRRAPEE